MPTSATRKKRPDPPLRPLPRKAIERGKAIAARYRLILWREDGEWYAQGVEEPGVMGDGRTVMECLRNARYALALAVASHIADDEPIVTPEVDLERRGRRVG